MISTQEKTKPITVIGKGKKDSDIEGYTIFKNHDKDLVKKIKEVTLSEDTFEYNSFFDNVEGGTCKIEKEMDGQLLCIGPDKKRFFLDIDEYKEIRETELLNKINNLYPVGKYFNENFGELIGDRKVKVVSGKEENLGYNDLCKVFSVESELNINIDKEIIAINFNDSRGGSTMFCFFDKDGNYVNRDYNLDIVNLAKQKPESNANLISKIKRNIENVKFQYANNVWYTEEYALQFIEDQDQEEDEEDQDMAEEFATSKTIGFKLIQNKINKNGTFGKYTKLKRPKETVLQTREHIMERIIPIINAMNLNP